MGKRFWFETVHLCCFKLPKWLIAKISFTVGAAEGTGKKGSLDCLESFKGKGCICMYGFWEKLKLNPDLLSKQGRRLILNTILYCFVIFFFFRIILFCMQKLPKRSLFCMEKDYCKQDCPSERWMSSGRHHIHMWWPLKVG